MNRCGNLGLWIFGGFDGTLAGFVADPLSQFRLNVSISFRRPRILIVDDDADSLANLTDILGDLGYETATAINGKLALDLVGEPVSGNGCRFDLCLIDFKMPVMDGAELFEQLRRRFPDLRTIMITAFAGEVGVGPVAAFGTWNVLQKPVDIPALLQLIAESE